MNDRLLAKKAIKNDPQYGPHRAVDESCSLTTNDAFISKGVSMEWFMIKFPFSVSGIIRVEIAKRFGSYLNFKYTDLRIGDVDESAKGAVHLTGNPLVATFQEALEVEIAVYDLTKNPAKGQFLVLQKASMKMEIGEVFVFIS